MKKLLVVSLILAMFGMAFGARKALVIGNARYAEKPLKNPVNDAELMRQTLAKLDFSVVKLIDVNRQAFDKAVREFAAKLEEEDEVVFYYSGHGVQVDGTNYLLPINEQIEDEDDVVDKALRLDWITSKLSSTAITMVFLDACRDNPYAQYRSNQKGLAMAGATGNNMFMMYSTEAGAVANDGKGPNSDFTSSLTTQMLTPGLSLDDISTKVTADVRESSNDSQRPWKIGSLSFKYYFLEPDDMRDSSYPAYQENGRGRISSTVEERMRRKSTVSDVYNPSASKYLTLHSANEIIIEDLDDNDFTRGQFVSRNTFGMKIPYLGVECFYNTVKSWQNADLGTGNQSSQIGAGAGMPDPEKLRLFAYLLQNNLSAYYPYENFLGVKGQLIKRVLTGKQFSELGCEIEYNQVPDTFDYTDELPMAQYFDRSALNWTPNLRVNAYLFASTVKNRYLEANNFRGLGPANSPLLLANQQASALIGRLRIEDRKTSLANYRDIAAEFLLPLNFGKVVGMDFGYNWMRRDDWDTEEQTSSSNLNGGLRITFLPMENFRLIGSAEYNRLNQDTAREDLFVAGHIVLKFTHHLAAMASFKYDFLWNRDLGFTELDPEGFIFGSTLAIRL
ncbi:hypothetical protein MASR1M36_13760 [Candidatus Cloacimonadaceae bacterium]